MNDKLNDTSNFRICVVSPLFHPDLGGVGRQAVLLTTKLKEAGIELFVLARKMKNVPEFKLSSDIKIYYIPAFRPGVHNLEEKNFSNLLTSLSFSLMMAIKLFVMRKRYELVHFHGASLPLVICLPLLKLLKKKVVAKVLASRLGTEAGSLKGRYFFFGDIVAYIMKKVDSFIAISQEIVDGLKGDGICTEKIKRITNFVDTARFSPANEDERERLKKMLSLEGKFVINFTGRIVARKGIDILINTFAKNKELLSSAIFIIAGTGPDEGRIKNLVLELGINENVRFLGHTSEPVKYYQTSDIFVLPSFAEGMPNSLLEAMACGLPAVASKIGGVVDIVEDGKSGILFDSGDVSGLASAMIKLLNDAELRQRLGDEARKRIVEGFSIDRIADEYVKLYADIMVNM
jgi:glycosyltransferase involved in cell wall biosynthesis